MGANRTSQERTLGRAVTRKRVFGLTSWPALDSETLCAEVRLKAFGSNASSRSVFDLNSASVDITFEYYSISDGLGAGIRKTIRKTGKWLLQRSKPVHKSS
jgi:hypothetical protein